MFLGLGEKKITKYTIGITHKADNTHKHTGELLCQI